MSSESAPYALGVVLVHGALHGAWCWECLEPELRTPSIAVDLPGRGARARPLADVTIDDCVQACLDDADAAGFDRLVLVGHSLGGVTISDVARQHRGRVAALVYVAAAVPKIGSSAAETFYGGPIDALPVYVEAEARALFGNDLADDVWAEHYRRLVPEAPGIMNARVAEYVDDLPRTYVYGRLDGALSPSRALEMITTLGEGVEVVEVNTGHSVMVAQPATLAGVIEGVVDLVRSFA